MLDIILFFHFLLNISNIFRFPQVKKNEFEPGTAQAFSILCRIFCHQRASGQAILPVYLSRFYLTLAIGLCYGEVLMLFQFI